MNPAGMRRRHAPYRAALRRLWCPSKAHFLRSASESAYRLENGSQQAAAAVHGAVPLIRRAKHGTVLIGRGKESLSSITRYPRMDIVGYLERHAAEVSTRAFEAHDWEAGARILAAADDTNSDVVVMGAYGHPAWRELFLGSATRHVLKHMGIPVLMAH